MTQATTIIELCQRSANRTRAIDEYLKVYSAFQQNFTLGEVGMEKDTNWPAILQCGPPEPICLDFSVLGHMRRGVVFYIDDKVVLIKTPNLIYEVVKIKHIDRVNSIISNNKKASPETIEAGFPWSEVRKMRFIDEKGGKRIYQLLPNSMSYGK